MITRLYPNPSATIRGVYSLAFLLITTATLAQQCVPQFNNSNETLSVSCGESIPEFSECIATSDCCTGLQVSNYTSETGNVIHSCSLSTAFGPGIDWAVWLPDMYGNATAWTFDTNGLFEEYADGTAHLSGTVVNASHPGESWAVSLWFENARNWADWSALGRSYKDDFSLAQTTHEDWTYYEMANGFSTLTGQGALEGSQLYLTHFPENYYYGFQAGVAANNKNGNEGLSGWFRYYGWLSGDYVTGHGDVNVDRSCSTAESTCASTAFTRICMAENDCDYVSFSTQEILVVDDQAPMAVEPVLPISLNCFEIDGVFIEATDNCSSVSITYTDEVVVEGCDGSFIRHYTLTDGCGNASSVDQLIELYGGIPEFTNFPEDMTVECSTLSSLDPGITYNEGCQNTLLSMTEEVIPGDCPNSYTLIYTYTLTDDCDNAVSQVWTISVFDATPPTLYNVPEDITIQCGDPVPDALVFALDNCTGIPEVGVNAQTIPMGCGYLFIRTWFATDGCGNNVEASQVITIEDNQAPTFSNIPDNQTFSCGGNPEIAMPTVEDACSSVTFTFDDSPLEGGCAGSFVRTITAVDGCGNTSEMSMTINIIDDLAPQFFNFPEDLLINCGEIPSVDSADISYADNCSEVSIDFSESSQEGDCPNSYTFFRTWTLTDQCGNSESRIWTIVVQDTEAPTLIGVPEDQSLSCGAEIGDVNVFAMDNCSSNIEVLVTTETNAEDCGYTFTRTWTATDDCGNTTTAVQVISVIDDTPPVFTFVPEDITLICGENTVLPLATATDACTDVTVTYFDSPTGDCSGSYDRIFTAFDQCGNMETATQHVTFIDDTAPEIVSFPENVTTTCLNVPSLDDVMIEFADACGTLDVSITQDFFQGACDGSYQILYSFIVQDACGNRIDPVWVITVVDNEGPVFSNVPENTSIECGSSLPEVINPTVTDQCSDVESISMEETTTELPCGFTVTRTWTAMDVCGNTSTASQTILVEDNTNPYFTSFPEDMTVSCSDAFPALVLPDAYDDCAGTVDVFYTDNILPGSCGGETTIQRVFRAFDNCGHQVINVQMIYVVDNTPPSFGDSPSFIELPCGDYSGIFAIASDDCNSISIDYFDTVIDGSCGGSIIRTYTAIDVCSNSSQFEQTISLTDTTPPVFTSFPSNTEVSCSQIPAAITSMIAYQDNCSQPVLSLSENIIEGACISSYTLERTYTITDACGNYTSAVWTIDVFDNTAPVLVGVPADATINCGDLIPDAIVFAQDNCSGLTAVGITANTEPTDCGSIFTRTWFTMDDCGNSSEAVQTIIAEDFTAPVLSGTPENITLACGDPIPAPANVTAFDNCAGVISVDFQEVSSGDNCGIIERTWCASDCAGLFTCYTQTISFDALGLHALTISSQSGNEIAFKMAVKSDSRISLELYNAEGQKMEDLYNGRIRNGEYYTYRLNTERLSDGVYLVRMLSNDGVESQKFVVTR